MALTPALWERIVETATGMPKPPPGHQTVCNLRADDRRTSFVASPPLTLSANTLCAGQVVTWAAAKLPH